MEQVHLRLSWLINVYFVATVYILPCVAVHVYAIISV